MVIDPRLPSGAAFDDVGVRGLGYGAPVENALEEPSPYYFQAVGMTQPQSMWRIVIEVLRRYEQTGIPQPELPRSIQRPGALVGLTIGLAVRQAALAAGAPVAVEA